MKKIAPKKTPGKKPEKVVPEAGETQYIVINPAQIEKLEEAVNRLTAVVENKRINQSISFPDDFWRKLYSGLVHAVNIEHSEREAVVAADALIAELGKVKRC